tara:strand:- start:5308 stop:6429 length:1122 start_codon:yes stop_codon:yes gene_type:complete
MNFMKIKNNKIIPYVDLSKQYKVEGKKLLSEIEKVLQSGQYILSEKVLEFEQNVCKKLNVQYCISVNSGTDALILSLLALNIGVGDEVITQSNSYIATAASIHAVGAKPVFADVLDDQTIDPLSIKKLITSRTKAIMPVHLTGRICEMNEILDIAKKNNLKIIEDSAQSFGSKYYNISSGSIGDCGAFSTHPLKNLNACGDGGFITTNNKKTSDFLKLKRNHGHIDRNTIKFWGTVSRLDSIQATILNFRLKNVDRLIAQRIKNADYYKKILNKEYVKFSPSRDYALDTYHLFVIQVKRRDKLKEFLKFNNIETAIHYPIPIHKQKFLNHNNYSKLMNTEKQSKEILSLPINQFMNEKKIKIVASLINDFFEN